MIVQPSELGEIRSEHRYQTIALRFGCYDLLHCGHQLGIDFAKSQADILVVGVLDDNYVRRAKGEDRPVNSERQRVAAIDRAEAVDYSFVASTGRLALMGVFGRLLPDVYVEDTEHVSRGLKQTILKLAGVDYVVDNQPHSGSSSMMIAELGVGAAREQASLTYGRVMPELPVTQPTSLVQ